MNTFDDVTLIRPFIAPEITLPSPDLDVESASNVTQLLTQNGELVAYLDRSTQPAIVKVKPRIQSWALLHQILSEHGLMVIQGAPLSNKSLNELEFICYEAQQIPLGYQMHCTSAKTLWKAWSAQANSRHRLDRRLELLLVTPTAWLPIQNVSCSWGIVTIKTLIKATSSRNGDYVTWLQKSSVEGEVGHDRSPSFHVSNGSYR